MMGFEVKFCQLQANMGDLRPDEGANIVSNSGASLSKVQASLMRNWDILLFVATCNLLHIVRRQNLNNLQWSK